MSDDAQQPEKTPEELAQEAADEYRAVCRRSPHPLTRMVAAGLLEELKVAAQERPPIHSEFWSRALLCAARLGELDALRVAAALTDCDLPDNEGQTALMLAAKHGHRDCVVFLADLSAPSMPDKSGQTALMQAAGRGDLDAVKILSRGAGFSQRDRNGDTALLVAAAAGHAKCVEFLLPLGDNREAAVGLEKSPTILMRAARSGSVQALDLLLPLSDPQELDGRQAHALAYAAEEGHADAVRRLLPLSDARLANADGMTSLMAAASHGHVGCLRVLLENGPPPGEQDGRSTSVFYSKNHSGRDLDLDRLVRGAGQTALMLAVQSHSVECVQLLLPISDFAAKDDGGRTALDIAALLQQWPMALLIAPLCAPADVKTSIELLAKHPPQDKDAHVTGNLQAIYEQLSMRDLLADIKASTASAAALDPTAATPPKDAPLGAAASSPTHGEPTGNNHQSALVAPKSPRRPRTL